MLIRLILIWHRYFTANICYSLQRKSYIHVSNMVLYLPHLWELWKVRAMKKEKEASADVVVSRKWVKLKFWVTNCFFNGCFECTLKLPVVWSDAVKCCANVPIEPDFPSAVPWPQPQTKVWPPFSHSCLQLVSIPDTAVWQLSVNNRSDGLGAISCIPVIDTGPLKRSHTWVR